MGPERTLEGDPERPPRVARGSPFRRFWRGVTVAEVQRFDAFLDRVSADCERRCGVGPSVAKSHAHQPWCTAASTHLESARRHRDDLRLESAWSAMKSAEREMISSLTDPNDRSRLCTVACVTRAEALAKVGSWRRESIELLLAEPCLAQLCECELSDEGLCVRVVEAKRILDDHADNIYHQLRILRRAVLLTTAWLAMVTLGLWLVVVFAEVPETVSPPNSPLRDGTLMLVVMLLGAAGAYLSSATRLASRNDDQRIPEIRVSHVLMAMRPVVGAASAVLVVVLVQSSLGPTVTLESTAVFGIAVAAGFTERLATRVVNSAVDSVGK